MPMFALHGVTKSEEVSWDWEGKEGNGEWRRGLACWCSGNALPEFE